MTTDGDFVDCLCSSLAGLLGAVGEAVVQVSQVGAPTDFGRNLVELGANVTVGTRSPATISHAQTVALFVLLMALLATFLQRLHRQNSTKPSPPRDNGGEGSPFTL